MYEVLGQLKTMCVQNRENARELFASHPHLALAVMRMQVALFVRGPPTTSMDMQCVVGAGGFAGCGRVGARTCMRKKNSARPRAGAAEYAKLQKRRTNDPQLSFTGGV